MPRAIDILACDSLSFLALAADFGVRASAALDVYRTAFRKGRATANWLDLRAAPIVRTLCEHGTTKFIQRHDDGLETESVILPIKGSTGRVRHTLCVSSQVGCAMGCTFCETAQMGLMKNLDAAKIVGQWFAARHIVGSPVDNVVFMGMGEPMDNLDAVLQAIGVFTDRNGPCLAPACISVSTVGRPEGIRRLAALARAPGHHKLRLAVSINAPNDEIRSRLMPINRAHPMATLMDAMLEWPVNRKHRVFIEYVLIPGVNDSIDHARELCAYLRPLGCTVNVIPYNPRRNSPWRAPDETEIRRFIQAVHDHGQFVKRRQTMGRSVMAACGQLGNPQIRNRRLVQIGASVG